MGQRGDPSQGMPTARRGRKPGGGPSRQGVLRGLDSRPLAPRPGSKTLLSCGAPRWCHIAAVATLGRPGGLDVTRGPSVFSYSGRLRRAGPVCPRPGPAAAQHSCGEEGWGGPRGFGRGQASAACAGAEGRQLRGHQTALGLAPGLMGFPAQHRTWRRNYKRPGICRRHRLSGPPFPVLWDRLHEPVTCWTLALHLSSELLRACRVG